MNIGFWIIIIIGGLAGVLSSGYLIVSLVVTIIYKIYRKIKYHEAIF
ncbi:MAG: hypothetical protein IK121_08360 [Lachnospiraceae bacterium]|nr:hypothetical protein [Lachnospiraceae bacterium]